MYLALRESIRKIAVACLVNYPATLVRYSHQDDPTPVGTYITMNILDVNQEGLAQRSGRLDTAGKITTLVPMSMMVGFSFTGSNAPEVAHSFYIRMKNGAAYQDEATYQNLRMIDKTSLRRIPYKDGETWVEYFNFNGRFNFLASYDETVLPVNQIVVEDVGQQITFTIP